MGHKARHQRNMGHKARHLVGRQTAARAPPRRTAPARVGRDRPVGLSPTRELNLEAAPQCVTAPARSQ
eukprot:6370252-Pyramimonas_sp.AAC.1